MKRPRPIVNDDDVFARLTDICEQHYVVEAGTSLASASKCRKLANWLLRAADYIDRTAKKKKR